MMVRSANGRKYLVVGPADAGLRSESQRLTLLAIAEFKKAGISDPSQIQISTMIGQCVRTVRRAIQRLEQLKLLIVTERFHASGHQLSHQYLITKEGRRLVTKISRLGGLQDGLLGHNHVRHVADSFTLPEGGTSCPPPKDVCLLSVEQLQVTKLLAKKDHPAAKEMLRELPLEAAQQLLDELRGKLNQGEVANPLGYLFSLKKAFIKGTYRPVHAGDGAAARKNPQS
ncbi:MAG: helix-turn-helix domain-containing protein [Moraxellaceae bacterium]|nr:helix-turn-helix domain-containing protein [Moraxellaceae bacterium]